MTHSPESQPGNTPKRPFGSRAGRDAFVINLHGIIIKTDDPAEVRRILAQKQKVRKPPINRKSPKRPNS